MVSEYSKAKRYNSYNKLIVVLAVLIPNKRKESEELGLNICR